MVWAAFSYDGRSELVIMERDPSAKKFGYSRHSYISALEEGLVPIYKPGDIFQQDNAPIHMALDVQEWLEKHGIWTLEWPPFSPDLNPIEHLWYHLKRKIIKLHPELETMGGSKEDLDRLCAAAKEAWMLLPQDLMRKLIDSMPRRIRAVIKAKGWQTKY
jgi:hypothetical protein